MSQVQVMQAKLKKSRLSQVQSCSFICVIIGFVVVSC